MCYWSAPCLRHNDCSNGLEIAKGDGPKHDRSGCVWGTMGRWGHHLPSMLSSVNKDGRRSEAPPGTLWWWAAEGRNHSCSIALFWNDTKNLRFDSLAPAGLCWGSSVPFQDASLKTLQYDNTNYANEDSSYFLVSACLDSVVVLLSPYG